ncbi:MAG: 3-phosphoshikimate 1-carboxyvinyltransferase [Oscillospiraceae bacterium]|nr:3-phosphoshikimate 1-carboxyvinyltransferase [Oscillospiraceae bacterium]
MNLIIRPSQAIGSVTAPPSKSMAHRQLIAAALGQEARAVENLEWSEDILATLDCLRALGASIERSDSAVTIGGLDPFAVEDGTVLPCRESGSTLRFLLPLALLSGRSVTFRGSERLLQRPLEPYERICAAQRLHYDRQRDSLTIRGPLRADVFELAGDISSQFVTGLLFALPFLPEPSRITLLPPVESGSYINMTLAVLRNYGIRVVSVGRDRFHIPANQKYRPHPVKVEGDWSNAAFLQAFNFLGGKVRIRGLDSLSPQGDKVFAALIQKLRQKKAVLNVSDCPDLAPILMALAAAGRGAVLEGTGRLRFKESDRGVVMAAELAKMGIQAVADEDRIWVEDGTLRTPTEPLDSHNDHRIAMALTVLLSLVGGELQNAEAVAKSWPNFYDVLQGLGIVIEREPDPEETP